MLEYTQLMLRPEEVATVTLKHLVVIIQNFNSLSKKNIKDDLLNLYDIIQRYSDEYSQHSLL